ncbi:tripartite ATP-independent transporter DctP family solute receptor [Paraburkholderia sp. BL6665CI2N2]|uniref:TRAP transporter substrate-binding protein n=1 Tax=Paraburkholderia sp. BL6665CI2N2 TaxID=1938806 RepID=UPI0010D5C8BA|nr:TRAP transporter substrate-binding protein [Paraburkholderia sp. BL6665CI2N2]TDY22031.1 tripartite ATP-independent transporter DctP family solute receptor [Paraburkholderia sp. BL6665CI2N2]
MISQSRRTLLKTVVVAPLAASIAAPTRLMAASTYTLKLGTDAPAGHPVNNAMNAAAQAIKSATNGQVVLQVFPNNQLGSSTDLIGQVRAGAIQLLSTPTSVLSALVPAAGICGVGFAFHDYDSVWKAMDGDLGAYIRAQIAKSELYTIDRIQDNGFRQITTSTKPVKGLTDLQGLKIRVPVSPLWTSLFSALQAAPTSINFSELYSALQTRVVDGQENALPIINSGRLYEVQKFVSVTNHMWDGYWVVANNAAFNALPANLRAIVEQQLRAAIINQRAEIASLNRSLQTKLQSVGMTFNAADTSAFRSALTKAGFYASWKSKFGDEAWALLERYSGKLA